MCWRATGGGSRTPPVGHACVGGCSVAPSTQAAATGICLLGLEVGVGRNLPRRHVPSSLLRRRARRLPAAAPGVGSHGASIMCRCRCRRRFSTWFIMVPVSLGAITVYSCREELNLNRVYQKNGTPLCQATLLSRRACSWPANASGVDTHRDSITRELCWRRARVNEEVSLWVSVLTAEGPAPHGVRAGMFRPSSWLLAVSHNG
jgi:hypothetical protein